MALLYHQLGLHDENELLRHSEILVFQHFPAQLLTNEVGTAILLHWLRLLAFGLQGGAFACGRHGEDLCFRRGVGVLDDILVNVLELDIARESGLFDYINISELGEEL